MRTIDLETWPQRRPRSGFMHPLDCNPVDSIPRFAWGKYFREGDCLKMPLGVQGHHALMDGVHAGRFYEKAQDYLSHPETYMTADNADGH